MDAPRDAKSLTAPGKGSKRDRTQPLGQRGPRCVCWLLFAVFLIVFGGALQDLRMARLATYGDVKRCLTVLREYLAGVLSIHECSFCRFSVPYQAEH